jgi:hypothetical protein
MRDAGLSSSPSQAARLPTCVIVECWVSSFVMRHMNSACSRVPISRANCHQEGKTVCRGMGMSHGQKQARDGKGGLAARLGWRQTRQQTCRHADVQRFTQAAPSVVTTHCRQLAGSPARHG